MITIAFMETVLLIATNIYTFIAIVLFLVSLCTFRYENPTSPVQDILTKAFKVSVIWPFLVYTSIKRKFNEKT